MLASVAEGMAWRSCEAGLWVALVSAVLVFLWGLVLRPYILASKNVLAAMINLIALGLVCLVSISMWLRPPADRGGEASSSARSVIDEFVFAATLAVSVVGLLTSLVSIARLFAQRRFELQTPGQDQSLAHLVSSDVGAAGRDKDVPLLTLSPSLASMAPASPQQRPSVPSSSWKLQNPLSSR
mgnify:CR=1 FL=1